MRRRAAGLALLGRRTQLRLFLRALHAQQDRR
jgi:hypothetical protein